MKRGHTSTLIYRTSCKNASIETIGGHRHTLVGIHHCGVVVRMIVIVVFMEVADPHQQPWQLIQLFRRVVLFNTAAINGAALMTKLPPFWATRQWTRMHTLADGNV
jgi:hypothetical protein